MVRKKQLEDEVGCSGLFEQYRDKGGKGKEGMPSDLQPHRPALTVSSCSGKDIYP